MPERFRNANQTKKGENGSRKAFNHDRLENGGEKCFMNSVGFDVGGEVVLEAITLLMVVRWYFYGGT